MPAFVVHALGKPAQKATSDKPEIRIGRDPGCDIVLPGASVSREHAVLTRDPTRGWLIRCVSETNAIVVAGALVTQTAWLAEGNEILIGSEYMLIFSENETKAANYMRTKSVYTKSTCNGCDWCGMVSALRKNPTCPRCGSTDLRSHEAYHAEEKSEAFDAEATFAVSLDQVRASLKQLKTAKLSRLERVDGFTQGAQKKVLSETETLVLKSGVGDLVLRGFSIGGQVSVVWKSRRYVVESSLWWPALKVNGEATKQTALTPGDLVEIGSNKFKFVTD